MFHSSDCKFVYFWHLLFVKKWPFLTASNERIFNKNANSFNDLLIAETFIMLSEYTQKNGQKINVDASSELAIG